MSRKTANNSPFALAQVKHGEFMRKPIKETDLTLLLYKLEFGKIRTYGELINFVKGFEKNMD